MLKSSTSDNQQCEQQHHDSTVAVVATQPLGAHHKLDPFEQTDALKISSHQLQAGVRRELFIGELNLQISFDHSPQPRYRQPHSNGLLCGENLLATNSLLTTQEAFFIQLPQQIRVNLFSDWG